MDPGRTGSPAQLLRNLDRGGRELPRQRWRTAPTCCGVNAVTGSGRYSGATDQSVERNSPAFSIQLSDSSGRITTLVQIAIHHAIQYSRIASRSLRGTFRKCAAMYTSANSPTARVKVSHGGCQRMMNG